MSKTVRIKGADDGQSVQVSVDNHTQTFKLNEDIEAESLFQALMFEEGVSYSLSEKEPGSIPEKSYNSFYELICKITKELSDLSVEAPSEEGSEDNHSSDDEDSCGK